MPQAGLLKKDLKGFIGVNLRMERLDLADEELAKIINADLHIQPRTIVLRLGRTKQFDTALADKNIRRLARVNALRYRVAGQTLYRDETAIFTSLSSNLFTTIVPFRPLLDDSLWAFVVDESGMKKDDGTNTFTWGIAASTTAPTAQAGTDNGSLAGDYTLRYTYLRKTSTGQIAHESNPSPVSNTATLTNHAVLADIADSSDSQVTHVRVYRTVAGGSLHLFDVEISASTKEHGYCFDWENDLLSARIAPASGYTDSGDIDGDTGYIVPGDFKPTYQFTTEFADETKAGTYPWEDGITSDSTVVIGVFPWEYDHITTDVSDTISSLPNVSASPAKFTTTVLKYEACHAWEQDHLNGLTDFTAQTAPVATMPQHNRWALYLVQADSALGGVVATDNNPPPSVSWGVEFQEHMFLCRDSSNPHYLWWSKRFRPESVPVANFIEIGNPSDPVQCAVPIAGLLGVFTRQSKYRVTGNSTSGFVHNEALSRRGTPAPIAVVPTEFGIVFPARDGVFSTNLITLDTQIAADILPLFEGQSVNGMDAINWDQAIKMSAAVYKRKYYLSYASGSSTEPNTMAVYSQDTQRWYFYDHEMRSIYVEEADDDLTGGGFDGFVYILEDGVSDGGTDISLEAETKDLDGGAADVRKLFRYFRIDADTQGDTLTVEFYIDDSLKRSVSFTSARGKTLFLLPEGSMGYQCRFRFTYSGQRRVRIYGASVIYLPLEAA